MATVTYLQLYVQHCRVEALVNDIVILRKNEKDITTLSCPIHEFVLTGENTLGLNVRPYAGAEFESSAQVHLRIANFEEGEFLHFDQGSLLGEIQFSLDLFAKDTPKTSYAQVARFLAKSTGHWAWQKAGIMVLNDQVISSLNKLMGSIHRDFQNKIPTRLLPMAEPRMQELAQCYPMEDLAARRQNMNEYITAPEDKRVRSLIPLDIKNLGYRLAAGGRLIECIGRDGLPLIRSNTANIDAPYRDDNYVALPMHVGFVGDDFQILR